MISKKQFVYFHLITIDDDKIFNFINEKQLEFSHLCENVNVYQDAGQALVELKEITSGHPQDLPNMIFVDVNMPTMDGWEFLEEFERLPELAKQQCKIFMLSSSIDERDVEKSKQYPEVRDYLTKPLTRDVLNRLFAA